MIDWFTGVLPFVRHAGGGGALVVGLLAAAYFSPMFKKEFIYAAAGVTVALFVYGVGVHDEKVRRDAVEQRVQTTVDRAVTDAKTSTQNDPFDSPRNY